MTSIQKARELHWMEPNTANGKIQHISSKKRGFTLIEIIIVLTLIGIIVGLGLPQYKHAAKRAREAVLKEDLFLMRKLIHQYYTDKGKYPVSLQALVEDQYLRIIPVDPTTKSAETWVEVKETLEIEDLASGIEPGVTDVFSGSDRIGTDGTPYNTW